LLIQTCQSGREHFPDIVGLEVLYAGIVLKAFEIGGFQNTCESLAMGLMDLEAFRDTCQGPNDCRLLHKKGMMFLS